MDALIFDCDGVLVDTERDGHRVAFNEAFKAKGLNVHWDVSLYGDLLQVAGGKERMKHFFNMTQWPENITDKDAFIKDLHLLKTDLFMKIIARGDLPLRPGVKRLVDQAIQAGISLAVCSTSNEKAVNLVVETMLGTKRKSAFAGIFAGDVVHNKKPDPEIYNLASRELGLAPGTCVVVEDSRNGLLAAVNAGMYCLVTKSHYTQQEDFNEADIVVDELGDPPNIQIELKDLQKLI
jgi:HAD superfamily hydrolase (TIGR01509 family)